MRLSRRDRLALVAAVITAGLVGVLAGVTGGRAIMPGALHGADGDGDGERHGGVRAHAEIDDCGRCHPGPFASRTASDLCLGCHDDIAAELADPTARHARNQARGRCLTCHTEHRGDDGDLTHVDRTGFDHESTGFSLRGHRKTKAGARFGCRDCHHGDVDHFPPDACETCHRTDDAAFVARHVEAWGPRCLACHDGVDRFGHGRFDHATTSYPLTGNHVTTTCVACHPRVRALAGYQEAPSRCAGCHGADDVHRGRFGDRCETCHTTGTWKEQVPGGFDHDRTAFPLTGAHRKVGCTDCHWEGRLQGTPTACALCHERPRHHFAGPCSDCHTTKRWRDVRRPQVRWPTRTPPPTTPPDTTPPTTTPPDTTPPTTTPPTTTPPTTTPPTTTPPTTTPPDTTTTASPRRRH